MALLSVWTRAEKDLCNKQQPVVKGLQPNQSACDYSSEVTFHIYIYIYMCVYILL